MVLFLQIRWRPRRRLATAAYCMRTAIYKAKNLRSKGGSKRISATIWVMRSCLCQAGVGEYVIMSVMRETGICDGVRFRTSVCGCRQVDVKNNCESIFFGWSCEKIILAVVHDSGIQPRSGFNRAFNSAESHLECIWILYFFLAVPYSSRGSAKCQLCIQVWLVKNEVNQGYHFIGWGWATFVQTDWLQPGLLIWPPRDAGSIPDPNWALMGPG